MRLSFRLNLSLVAAVALVSLGFAVFQAQSETHGLRVDLDRQAVVLAESLEKSVAPLVAAHSYRDLQRIVDRFQDHERLAGVAVYDSQGRTLAVTPNLTLKDPPQAVDLSVKDGLQKREYFTAGSEPMHVFALPLRGESGSV